MVSQGSPKLTDADKDRLWKAGLGEKEVKFHCLDLEAISNFSFVGVYLIAGILNRCRIYRILRQKCCDREFTNHAHIFAPYVHVHVVIIYITDKVYDLFWRAVTL